MLFSGVRSNNNLNIDVCYEIKRLNNIETNEIIYLNLIGNMSFTMFICEKHGDYFISYIAYLSIGLLLLTLCNLIFSRLLIISYNLHHIPHNIMWECGIFEMLHILDFPRTNHDLSSFHSIHKSISMQCVKIAWKAQYVYK